MVNPQLETIKEPPPHTDRIVTRTKSRELQSAISSISPETNTSDPVSMTFEEFEAMNEKTRKKRGRPKGRNEIRQKAKGTNGDFQDDPELSLELEKFAVQFNLNRLYWWKIFVFLFKINVDVKGNKIELELLVVNFFLLIRFFRDYTFFEVLVMNKNF